VISFLGTGIHLLVSLALTRIIAFGILGPRSMRITIFGTLGSRVTVFGSFGFNRW
jgi:hypothetical protein